MLKLFRSIRRKLLDTSNFRKYLVYAIGEIALVMIGILLALQVNNWNQERLNRQNELNALVDLREEFLVNKQRFEEKQERRLETLSRVDKFLDLISRDSVSYSDFVIFQTGGHQSGMTNPSFGVVNSLIASGDIKLISNDSLKYLLTDWKDFVGDLMENEQILWDRSKKFREYETIHLPPYDRNWRDWPRQKLEANFEQHIKTVEYRNRIIRHQGGLTNTIRKCDITIEGLEKILQFIEQEIKANS